MHDATARTVLTTPEGLLGIETMQNCILQPYKKYTHPHVSLFELLSIENDYSQICAATSHTKYPELCSKYPLHTILIAVRIIETPHTITCRGNMRCPIHLNQEAQTAKQYIFTHANHPMDAVLLSLHKPEIFNV